MKYIGAKDFRSKDKTPSIYTYLYTYIYINIRRHMRIPNVINTYSLPLLAEVSKSLK